MEKKSNFKIFLVFLIFLVFIAGGYFLMQKSFDSNFFSIKNPLDNTTVNKKEEFKDIRIDNTKEYIYFTDSETIEGELDIEYKNVVINFNDNNNISKKLNDETREFKEKLEFDKENEDAVYDGLISALYKKYIIFEYDKYISLVVNYYSFDNESLISYLGSKTYVFDKKSGSLYLEDDLIKEFKLTCNDIENKIKEYLEGQDLLKEEETLDIEGTLDNMESYNLYVDKVGRLTASILVKSDKNDYNENIILN